MALLLLAVSVVASPAAAQQRTAIYDMKPDGADVRMLVSMPGMIWHGGAAYSPDQSRLAFHASAQSRDGSSGNIYISDARDPQGTAHYVCAGKSPQWSPDGLKIAFVIPAGNPHHIKPGVWTMNADGMNRLWRCDGVGGAWSPDGTRLAVATTIDREATIYMVTPRFRKRVLAEPYDRIAGVTWSPDGRQLAFIGRREGQSELSLLGAKGDTESFRVRWRGNLGGAPRWSPDGRQIAFWINRDNGACRLNLIDPEGTAPPREIPGQNAAYYNGEPEWTPDGARLLFASDRDE